mmetsp:Transcript_68972/g.136727  ORF Transcript_68972/g.136727 Transcript_68972/m.136727 type:complete len:210 (-) Transcript_68972:399-1028(-)
MRVRVLHKPRRRVDVAAEEVVDALLRLLGQIGEPHGVVFHHHLARWKAYGVTTHAYGVRVESRALDWHQQQVDEPLGMQLDGGDQLARAPVRLDNVRSQQHGKSAALDDSIPHSIHGGQPNTTEEGLVVEGVEAVIQDEGNVPLLIKLVAEIDVILLTALAVPGAREDDVGWFGLAHPGERIILHPRELERDPVAVNVRRGCAPQLFYR